MYMIVFIIRVDRNIDEDMQFADPYFFSWGFTVQVIIILFARRVLSLIFGNFIMWIFNYLLILSEISRTVPSFLFRFAREDHPSFIQ